KFFRPVQLAFPDIARPHFWKNVHTRRVLFRHERLRDRFRLFFCFTRHEDDYFVRHVVAMISFMTTIKFGTSGWRAIIADEFTFSNVRLATEAIGRWVKRRTASPAILVGYDTRFASENFGREVARVLSSQNI